MLLEAINISYNFPIRKKMHFLCYGCKVNCLNTTNILMIVKCTVCASILYRTRI